MAASRPKLTPADIQTIECFALYTVKKTEDRKNYLHYDEKKKYPMHEKEAVNPPPVATFFVFYNCKDAKGQPLSPLVVPITSTHSNTFFFSEDVESSREVIARIKKIFAEDKEMSKGFKPNIVSNYEKLELVSKSEKDSGKASRMTYHTRIRLMDHQRDALIKCSVNKEEIQNRLAAARNRIALLAAAEEKQRALDKQQGALDKQQQVAITSSSSLVKVGSFTLKRNASVVTYQQPQRVASRSSVTAADCLAAAEELESELGIVRAEGRRGVLAACNNLQEGGAASLAGAKSGRSSNRGVFSNATPAAQPAVQENAKVYYVDMGIEMTDLGLRPAPRALQPMRTPVNR